MIEDLESKEPELAKFMNNLRELVENFQNKKVLDLLRDYLD